MSPPAVGRASHCKRIDIPIRLIPMPCDLRCGGQMFGRSNPDALGDALVKRANAIETREDFHQFGLLLAENYSKHRKEWENSKLDQYLDGIAAFSGDFEGYVRNTGNDAAVANPWRLLATVLLAAKVYE